jgi:preprotein translocase subunit Sec63
VTRGSKKTVALADELMKLVNEVEPKAALKYNKHYIGLEVEGSPFNFVTFMPRKAHLIMTIKGAKSEQTDNALEDAGLVTLEYNTYWKQYRLRLDKAPDEKQRGLLVQLIRQAREVFGKAA